MRSPLPPAGIQARGRALLERIQTALSDSDDGVSLEQIAALESKVRREAEQLLDKVVALGDRLRELNATAALADAGRISAALREVAFGNSVRVPRHAARAPAVGAEARRDRRPDR